MGTIEEAIEEFRKKRLAVYKADHDQIVRDERGAERAAKDHVGRWLFELLQNSDDADVEADVSGKAGRRAKSFRLRRDAERFRTAKQKEFNEGVRRSRPTEISLGLLCNKVLTIRKSTLRHKSITCYENTVKQLRAYFGPDKPLRRIGPEQAAQFVASRKLIHKAHTRKAKVLSSWGRNQHLEISSTIFAEAVTWGYLSRNPFAGIRPAKKESRRWHHIIPREFESILRVTPDRRTRAMYGVMYGAGLRYGEAINLLWNGRDIDFERGLVEVANKEGTADIPPFFVKDHELRCVPLPKWVQKLLLEAQAEAAEGCPFAFLTAVRWDRVRTKWHRFQREGRAREWQNSNVCNNALRNFKARCRRAGIVTSDKLTIHCLRKSYAQNLADAGTPIHTLKKLMGHSSVKTLECFYIRSSDANEAKARKVLDSLFPPGRDDSTILAETSSV